ncbi:MAG: S46 family peptidase, partial [Planctomycetota bacterium]
AAGIVPSDSRRALYEGGVAALAASRDTMLAVARLVDQESRSLRRIAEEAEEVKRQAHAEIMTNRFATEGTAMYPDATFSLRLAYGLVKGYGEDGPRRIAPITTYAGLFARATAKRETPPFDLPPRWRTLRDQLQADASFMATPLNFVSTADIIGGNSGSPVVNRDGRLVGVIFDGNIESLVLDVAYDDRRARAISVDATGILAALRTVYRADDLVNEVLATADGRR